MKPRDHELIEKWIEKVKKYQEEITVYLVVDDRSLLKEIDDWYEDDIICEFELHKVASYHYEEQSIIDNLEFYEKALFDFFNINTHNIQKTVYHYGLD